LLGELKPVGQAQSEILCRGFCQKNGQKPFAPPYREAQEPHNPLIFHEIDFCCYKIAEVGKGFPALLEVKKARPRKKRDGQIGLEFKTN